MATLVQKNLLVNEVNKRKRLGLYYRLAFVFLAIAIVAGLMSSFHKMSKSIKKNNKQLASLQDELESYKMSQSKAQGKLNDDLKAMVQELKTMNLNLNSLKGSFDTQKNQVTQNFNQSNSKLAQLQNDIALTVLGIKNQRDEMKLRLESLDSSHIDLKLQLNELVSSVKDSDGKFEQISAALEILKNQTSKVLDVVEEQNNKTILRVNEEAANWNTSAVQTHAEVTSKNFSLGNQTNQTWENSGKIMGNNTIANTTSIIPNVVGNSTLVIMDEPVKEVPQVKQEQKQEGGFTALLKKKATAVKEFVSKNVDNVIQKLKPSDNLPNVTIQAEEIVNTTTQSKGKSATQMVAKGFSDVKKYVGDTLGSLFVKEKATIPEKISNQPQNPQNLTTEKEMCKRDSSSYMHLVWNDVLNISHHITGNDNEKDKRAFLSLEPLFSELGLLSENMTKNASGAWKKWHKGYEALKQAYEATKETLKQEQNTSSKGFQKRFHKQVQKYLAKVNNLGQGQWF